MYRIRVTPDLTLIAAAIISIWGTKLGLDALCNEWNRNENRSAKNEAELQEIADHLKNQHPSLYERLENLSKEKMKIGNNRWDLLLNGACFSALVGLLVATLANAKFFTVTSGYNSQSF
jgi:uncharacterized membrane protein YraQ (UPF0718 family)